MTTTNNPTAEASKAPVLQITNPVNDEPLKEKECTVSFRCSESQKSLLIKKAITESGLNLSEFIKYKLFNEINPEAQKAIETEIDVLQDEERTAYEGLVKRLRGQIMELTDANFELKAKNVILKEEPAAPANPFENTFTIEFFENVKKQVAKKNVEIGLEDFIDMCIQYSRYVNNEHTGLLSSVPEISKFIVELKNNPVSNPSL